MKRLFLTLTLVVLAFAAAAQGERRLPYDEGLDAMAQIDAAVAEAGASGRFVLCQVGGNWCPWCVRFADFVDTNQAVNHLVHDNFVYIHVNYSPKRKNLDAMNRLGNPGRFGYPAFVVLDGEGRVVHIQSSAYLEEGKGYSERKVLECFGNWTPKAVAAEAK